MTQGLRETLESSGERDRVLILGKSSRSEINGSITRDQAAVIAGLPGIAKDSRSGRPLLSAELYANANLLRKTDGQRSGLPLRGVSELGFAVRPEVRITQGRAMQPGRFELMVGAGAVRIFEGLEVGDTLSNKGATFEVVGHFVSDGRATESEAWLDVDVMANVFKRGVTLNTLLGRLQSPDSLRALTTAIDRDRRLSNSMFRESVFYAEQSTTATRLMVLVGTTVGLIMALGAISTALNALYVAVSARTREIAILRALGYSVSPIVFSVLLEALTLSLVGGVIGAVAGWALFDGIQMSSMGAAYSHVAFRFAVSPALLLTGLSVALVIGFLGGLFPALRAIRVNVIDGLRAGA